MSDGSSRLRVLDPATFAERRRIAVTDNGAPVRDLNELEVMQGQILANVWHTDQIARIDPGTGRVTGWLNLAGLLAPAERPSPGTPSSTASRTTRQHDRLFVTGKLWPKLFERLTDIALWLGLTAHGQLPDPSEPRRRMISAAARCE